MIRCDRLFTAILPCSLLFLFSLSSHIAYAQGTTEPRYSTERTRPLTPSERRTAAYFDSIRHDPLLLAIFLRQMPKGADLHNHLSGAIYAESYMEWLVEADGCVDTTKMTATACTGGSGLMKASAVWATPTVYRRVIDAWSMRNGELSGESGHDQFFDTFDRFGAAGSGRDAEMLAEARTTAARDRLQYLELMRTLDGGRVARLGVAVGWDGNVAETRRKLLAAGLRDSLRVALQGLTLVETRADSLLGCAATTAPGDAAACSVEARYLYQVLRGLPPQIVFAQILAGFELAEIDPRVVGFNLVMPEDYPVPLRDFDLHMEIINSLRPLYTKAHISLHAGELAPGLVPPDELCCHIRKSVEVGHAERIGHGVDIAWEDDPYGTLALMAEREVTVEVCLTSNDVILGVSWDRHPLHLYIDNGIATCLATDDEGVSRIDLTHEFVKGALEQNLGYLDLKRMVRTSLERSFLPGESLWEEFDTYRLNSRSGITALDGELSPAARSFLETNEKAAMQWELERLLREFEEEW